MFDLNELKDKIAVIGVGNTKYGNFPEIDDYGLAAHAFRNAVNAGQSHFRIVPGAWRGNGHPSLRA